MPKKKNLTEKEIPLQNSLNQKPIQLKFLQMSQTNISCKFQI